MGIEQKTFESQNQEINEYSQDDIDKKRKDWQENDDSLTIVLSHSVRINAQMK